MSAVQKTACLIIDEGPAEHFLHKIDFLNANGMQSIWFCLGEALEDHVDAAIYAIKHGHAIANRGYTYTDFSKISLNEAREQLEKTERLIEKIYEKAAAARPFKAFRFPYLKDERETGHFSAIQRILGGLGYPENPFAYTYDTFDIGQGNIPYAEGAQRLTGSNEIILIHEWIALDAFKALIEKMKAANIRFKLPEATVQVPVGAF
ncbi:polysaccharide deacetylase family protein [Paenibacillus alkaliterrae]|uniref:polysaccharide deacetylase family protein n=1 Tax=Paenibacillus alkaliterrae TaxID=320909 RepID=UPI001F1D2454|nr:polysaccharide deacetylase family protein [Paenibacillus alkaliterrae]MCF2941584.1 polysaccharide deacetylase family protein [Paenibacillus alkaliterrae]